MNCNNLQENTIKISSDKRVSPLLLVVIAIKVGGGGGRGCSKRELAEEEVASSPLLVCTARAGWFCWDWHRNSLPEQNYEIKKKCLLPRKESASFFFFLSVLCSLCDLSAPTRDWTHGPWQWKFKSIKLDSLECQGIPRIWLQLEFN